MFIKNTHSVCVHTIYCYTHFIYSASRYMVGASEEADISVDVDLVTDYRLSYDDLSLGK